MDTRDMLRTTYGELGEHCSFRVVQEDGELGEETFVKRYDHYHIRDELLREKDTVRLDPLPPETKVERSFRPWKGNSFGTMYPFNSHEIVRVMRQMFTGKKVTVISMNGIDKGNTDPMVKVQAGQVFQADDRSIGGKELFRVSERETHHAIVFSIGGWSYDFASYYEPEDDRGMRDGHPDYVRPYFHFSHDKMEVRWRGGYGLNQWIFAVEGDITKTVDATLNAYFQENPQSKTTREEVAKIARLALGEPAYILAATRRDKEGRTIDRAFVGPDGNMVATRDEAVRFDSWGLAFEFPHKLSSAWWVFTQLETEGLG